MRLASRYGAQEDASVFGVDPYKPYKPSNPTIWSAGPPVFPGDCCVEIVELVPQSSGACVLATANC